MVPDPGSRLYARLKWPELRGLGLGTGFGGSVSGGGGGEAPPPPDVSPNLDWRPGISLAFSSDGSAPGIQFGTDLQNSGGSAKTWPTRQCTAGTYTETAVFTAALAAPGGFAYYLVQTTRSGQSIAAAYSTDTTNGVDGTWNSLPVDYQDPDGALAGGGRMVRIPTGAKGYRQTFVTGGTTQYRLKFHQRSASGRDPIMATFGSSIEASCFTADRVWDEKVRLEGLGLVPTGWDPMLFDYYKDAGSSDFYIATLQDVLTTQIPEVRYANPGTMCGVELRLNTPYASLDPDTDPELVDVRENTEAFSQICIAAGVIPVHCGPNYRDLVSQGGRPPVQDWLHPENGVLPGMVDLMWPAIHSFAPDFWDPYRNQPLFVDYETSVGRYWDSKGGDGVHMTDEGYKILRRERCIFLLNWWNNDTPALNVVDRRLATLATKKDWWVWQGVYNTVYPLPASAWRTAVLAQLATYEAALETDLIKISLSGPNSYTDGFEPGWNLLNSSRHNTLQTFYNPTTSPLQYTDMRSATGHGFALVAQSGTATFSATGGGATTNSYDEMVIPDQLMAGSYHLNSGASRTFEVYVPDAGPYTFRFLTSRPGSVASNTGRLASVTIQGVTKTQNPGSANALGNQDWLEWNGVVPTSGVITIVMANSGGSGSDNQAIEYINETATVPLLGAIGVDVSSKIITVPWVANITGVTPGTTLITCTSSDGTVITCTNIGGDNWTASGTFTVAGTPTLSWAQTHPTASNSIFPNDTSFTALTQPTLVDLSVDNLLGTVGTQYVGVLTGNYGLALSGQIVGDPTILTVITDYGDHTEATANFTVAGIYTMRIREAEPGCTNPGGYHDTDFTLTISAASGPLTADDTTTTADDDTHTVDEG